jgi:hypothetical protein
MSFLAKYYASLSPPGSAQSAYAQSLSGGSLGSSQAQGTTPQVQEAQDNLAADAGELVGRLFKRQMAKSAGVKAVREAGGFEGMDRKERKELKREIGKSAGAAAFADYGDKE